MTTTTAIYDHTVKGLMSSNPDLIKSIETFHVRPRWLFVRVETEKGIVGWGEATLEGEPLHCAFYTPGSSRGLVLIRST